MEARRRPWPPAPVRRRARLGLNALLDWGRPRLRDLPWRRTRDPWAVLVSEVMLQQTQVVRVIPKWEAFIAAYPTAGACAAAPLGEVLRSWHGLGYPRRAANLHRAATAIATAGVFPATLDGLQALPGVGGYTARAVLAFAFEADAAVVDTNIARVHARLAGRRLTRAEVQAAADGMLQPGNSWMWNQCLMDLGAAICRARDPRCGECPLADRCAWRGRGDDPAVGSSGVSGKQARFDGSDRQARGRILARLLDGAADELTLQRTTGRGASTTRRLVEALRTEGLVVADDGIFRLP